MKLGVLGGTFDPIHLGHLAAAEAARAALALDRVLFVPAGDPWLKAGATISPGEHRLAMVRAAIEGVPAYEASTVEVDRPGPTYTEVTLAQLQETYGPDTDCTSSWARTPCMTSPAGTPRPRCWRAAPWW